MTYRNKIPVDKLKGMTRNQAEPAIEALSQLLNEALNDSISLEKSRAKEGWHGQSHGKNMAQFVCKALGILGDENNMSFTKSNLAQKD